MRNVSHTIALGEAKGVIGQIINNWLGRPPVMVFSPVSTRVTF